jgi:serine/threonine-protein kinase
MSHTRAGTLKGKLAYMSPEQVHGEGIDRRTDVFALGVVLWELTTGQRLFRMESDLDTLAKVQECNVARPSTLIRGYPVDLEKIVMKALAKNRGERFSTAREFSRELQSLLMRRGLFIASDEVAAYTQSIFNDRIQKREAHLRWAAEVTSTINVEQLRAKPKLGPEFTGASDVQPQARPAGVRPAAGMPASVSGPMAEPDRAGQRGASPQGQLHETGPSVPTQARPPRPPPAQQPGRSRPPPRPAAGMPPTPSPRPHVGDDDDHPADGEGPTIQALPPMLDPLRPSRGARDTRPQPPSEPPTVMEQGPESSDGPTMMASPGARAQMLASTTDDLAGLPSANFGDSEDEELDAATMVANPRGEVGLLHAPPTFPPTPPAAGRISGPPDTHRPAFLAPVGVTQPQPSMLASGYPRPAPPPPLSDDDGSQETRHLPPGFEPTPFAQAPGPRGLAAGEAPRGGPLPPEFNPRTGATTGPSGDFIPRHSGRMQQPTVARGAGFDNHTMAAQRLKRRPPMWVVAALSCSVALLIAGVVMALVSSTGGAPTPKPAGAGSADHPVGVATGPGPFTSARAAFNAAVAGPSPAPAPATTSLLTPTAVTAPPPAAPPTPEATAASATPAPSAAATTAAATAAPATPAPRPASSPPPAAPAASPAKKPSALGAITVVCMPKCDQIIDNGTSLGPGHIFNRPVPSGRHNLQLSAPNGTRKNLVVEVVPDQTKEVRMSMDK